MAGVSVFAIMYGGLLLGCAAYLPDVAPTGGRRSFAAFLSGEVGSATGWISGRAALAQIAAMPLALAVGMTAIVAAAVAAGL